MSFLNWNSKSTSTNGNGNTDVNSSHGWTVLAALGGIAAASAAAGGAIAHLYYRSKIAEANVALLMANASANANAKLNVQPQLTIAPSPAHKSIINTARPGVFSPQQTSSIPSSLPTPLLLGSSSRALDHIKPHEAVIIVDPISTGANVAYEFQRRGIPCVRVVSGFLPESVNNLIDESIRTDFVATVHHDSSDANSTITQLASLPYPVVACVSGSELGIEVSDFISEALGLPTNGTELTNARRDKYQMGECVRRCGVRAVKQARVQSWEECAIFLANLKPVPFRVIVKPIRSSGSDAVYLCTSEEEVKTHLMEILGHLNQLGFVNDAVVVQEYLEGIEYVVDTVSRRGKHKVVAIWQYDKRRVHGHNFVYYGMGSVSGKKPIGKALAQYIMRVLDALNIVEGAGHAEVIMTIDGPCLVEIGARCHGGEGTFIPVGDKCWGYNQVSTLVSATISQSEFDAIPDVCGTEKEYGFKIDFVSPVSGVLQKLEHLDEIRGLKTFLQFDMLPKPGDRIHKTIDCFTAVGSVTLIGERTQVEQDHETIRKLEETMFVVAE